MAARMIVTSPAFSTEKYRLLELNPEVEEAFLTGDRISIVGEASQRAVLCTSKQSFVLAKEDISNERLLTQHTQWHEEKEEINNENTAPENTNSSASHTTNPSIVVDGSVAFHYVLLPHVPDLMQLKSLLLESPYTQQENDKQDLSPRHKRTKHTLYSTEDLMVRVQASERELMDMLMRLHAFEDAGYWRVLEPTYEACVFSDILDAAIQNDWDFLSNGISIASLLQVVDAPKVVLRQCLTVYTSHLPDEKDDLTHRYVLDPTKVAIFYAKQLLTESYTSSDWELDTFMEKWQLRVPTSIQVNESMLAGIAICKTSSTTVKRGAQGSNQLVYLCESDLPMDAKKRFERLFQIQEKWTIAQLEPYISPLVRPGITQASLLLKHSRSSRQANSTERLYSKR